MPLVRVRYDPFKLQPDVRHDIGLKLRGNVAGSLTCDDPDGRLTPDDIEVFFDPYSPADRTDFDVFIDIEASSFPSRRDNYKDRVAWIGQGVKDSLPGGLAFGLWLKLIDNPGWYDSRAHTT